MAWRAVYDAQWGRERVDVTVGTRAEAARLLAAEVEEGLRDLGDDCAGCREQGEQALRLLADAEGAEVEAEIDGELYQLTRA
jgi:hypothetical protein